MEPITITLLIMAALLVFAILVTIGWAIGVYNACINGVQNIKTQWSNVKTEYQRRADLFYNLVQAVKSHMKFEKSTLIDVTKLRNVNFGNTPKEGAAKMKELDNFFSKLLVTVENYPSLKSGEQYNKFIDEARITEDRVNVSRTDYNDVVREYNILIKSFPANMLARTWNFTEERFYINEATTNVAPRVDFGN